MIQDVDQDGLPDLVASITVLDRVGIYFGLDDGRFETPIWVEGLFDPGDLAALDYDQDGDPDLLVTQGNRQLTLVENKGSRTFDVDHSISLPHNPADLELADLDADGNFDVVLGSEFDEAIMIVLNQGFGSFADPVAYSAAGITRDVAVRDLNGDLVPDIAVTTGFDRGISLFFSQGDGSVSGELRIGTQYQFFDVEAADFDGDGKADLIAAAQGNVYVFRNLVSGIFDLPQIVYSLDAISELHIADFSSDGLPDIITIEEPLQRMSLLMNEGDGTCALFSSQNTGGKPWNIADDDLNGDSIPDYVVCNLDTEDFSIIISEKGGSYPAPSAVEINGEFATDMMLIDMNLDGVKDLITIHGSFDTIRVRTGTGQGSFDPPEVFLIDQSSSLGEFVDGHLNDDDSPDFVILDGNRNLQLFTSGPDVSLVAMTTLELPDPIVGFVTVDIDRDQDDDLIVSTESNNGDVVRVYENYGAGQFVEMLALPASNVVKGLVGGDFDLDGSVDFAGATSGGIAFFYGDGQGSFEPEFILPIPGSPRYRQLVAENLDQDTDLDFVILSDRQDGVFVVENLGQRMYDNPAVYGADSEFRDPHLCDLDQDNDLDLVLVDIRFERLHVLMNDSGGHMTEMTHFGAGVALSQAAMADLNQDGQPDLVTYSNGAFNGGDRMLALHTNRICPACQIDLNGDGAVNFFDVSAFLSLYFANDLGADQNGDGLINFFDVSAFLNAYNAGCP